MRPSYLFMILCLIVTFTAKAQDKSEDDFFEVLVIEGAISDSDGPLGDVTMELYEGNKLVETIQSKNKGKFKFTLYDNLHYTIQTIKDGYQTKRIAINTHVPEDFEGTQKFDFDISMAPIEDMPSIDETLFEFPATLISYHPKKEEFFYDQKYTSALKAEISASK